MSSPLFYLVERIDIYLSCKYTQGAQKGGNDE